MMFRGAIILGWLLAAGGAAAQSVVPIRAIRAHSVLTAADVSVVGTSYPGAAQRVEDVLGQEARVALYPGRAILLDDISAPAVVDRNQIVTMIYEIGGLHITAEGRVLERAGLGEMVRIMNTDSRVTVSGIVLENGSVEVGR